MKNFERWVMAKRYEVHTLQEITKERTENPLSDREFSLLEEWKERLDTLDKEFNNNDRRYYDHRSSINIHSTDCEHSEDDYLSTAYQLKLSQNDDDWLDYIYSKRYEDLQELVLDEKLYHAIKKLTDLQKQALYLWKIQKMDTKQISNIMGSSEKNVRNHRNKAIMNIRRSLALHDDKTESAKKILTRNGLQKI